MKSLLFLFLLVSCGKSDHDLEKCRPQEIAIAECMVEEFEKNPNQFMIESQRKYCEQLYPVAMCYYP